MLKWLKEFLIALFTHQVVWSEPKVGPWRYYLRCGNCNALFFKTPHRYKAEEPRLCEKCGYDREHVIRIGRAHYREETNPRRYFHAEVELIETEYKKQRIISEVDRLRLVAYESAPGDCDESCPFYDWYDGPMCEVTGAYLEEQPNKDCAAAQADVEKMKKAWEDKKKRLEERDAAERSEVRDAPSDDEEL